MKISKLFHWLYASLMLLPFVALAFNFLRIGLNGSMAITSYEDVMALVVFPTFGNLSATISDVYSYAVVDLFGLSGLVADTICNGLTYWTIVSIIYLIFDVIMYVPLLVHRWIDKAVIQ